MTDGAVSQQLSWEPTLTACRKGYPCIENDRSAGDKRYGIGKDNHIWLDDYECVGIENRTSSWERMAKSYDT